MIAQLKDDFAASLGAPPPATESDEPYHLSEAYETEQIRKIVSEAEYPSRAAFGALVRQHVSRLGDEHADAFDADEDLVYESVAKLFYASATHDWPAGEQFKHKARQVGVALNAEGGFALMQCGFYAFSWLVQQLERKVTGGSHPWTSAFTKPVEWSFSGVGEWRF